MVTIPVWAILCAVIGLAITTVWVDTMIEKFFQARLAKHKEQIRREFAKKEEADRLLFASLRARTQSLRAANLKELRDKHGVFGSLINS